jgi:hypothetical protein
VPGASARINDLQGPKSLINTYYINKKDEEVRKLRSQKY